MTDNLEIKIVCEDEKYMPTYANETDGCMDLKAYGEYIIEPKSTKVIDTGVKLAVPEDYVMQMFVRSSIGIKHGCSLANDVGIIDAGYRDVVKVALYNRTDKLVKIQDSQRIAQFMILPRPKIKLIPVEDNEDFRNGDRGGGIGSTGKM